MPDFQAYCGEGLPRFANDAELECAKLLDYHSVPWDMNPGRSSRGGRERTGRRGLHSGLLPSRTGALCRGHRDEAVARDPQEPQLRKLRERYPDVKIKLFYKRDIERLAQRYHLDLAS